MRYTILALAISVLMVGSTGFAKNIRLPFVSNSVSYVGVTSFQVENGVLTLAGTLPTTCHQNPMVRIDSIDNDNLVIKVGVIAFNPSDVCIETVGNPYEVNFDLNTLDLKKGTSYQIEVINLAEPIHVELTKGF